MNPVTLWRRVGEKRNGQLAQYAMMTTLGLVVSGLLAVLGQGWVAKYLLVAAVGYLLGGVVALLPLQRRPRQRDGDESHSACDGR